MIQWLAANWQAILLGMLAIDTVLVRLFPNVGFFQSAEKDLEEVAAAAGVKPAV